MKILVEGRVYDSTKTPILIQFDENEKEFFNMRKFVSAPETSTKEERQRLIDTDLDNIEVIHG
ncbi:MAG: hypothetical protein ABS939_13740 [Psychrobacillus sp.]